VSAALAWLPTVVVALLTGHTVLNTVLLRRLRAGASTVDGAVTVLLPLRDEADRVAPCLRALLAQRGVPGLRVLVLDDNSTDGTAALVRELAGDRVTLLTGAPLPPGWLGKPWACQQLADAARQDPARRLGDVAQPDTGVLVFVDADVVLAPDALAAALTLRAEQRFDLLSAYPRLVARSPGERLVQPLLPWSWLTFLPLRLMERSPRPSLTAAGGQLLLVTRDGYDRAGGHSAVRDRVLEDIELARAVKRAGGRIGLATAHRLADCRMYTSWAQVRDGYSKSLWASFGSPAGAAGVLALLALAYLAPLAVLPWAPLAGGCGYLLGVLGRVLAGRATGARTVPDALAHPVSVLLFGYLVVRSYRLHRRGGLAWKGRPV
jgi:hypothetical protein